jgi:hypothetical protein
MTDRIPLDDLTSDQLDDLYARAEQAEAAVERARTAVHIADDEDVTDWQRGYRACSVRALGALGEQPGPAATDAAGQCWHTEAGSPCDWNECKQPERLAAGDLGTDPREQQA